MNILEKFLTIFQGDERDNDHAATQSGRITNKQILSELSAFFTDELEEMSVGKRMIYPMSFNVLLHPDDYEYVSPALMLAAPEFVAAFYGIIKSKRNKYPDFLPPATYWFLQFSACSLNEISNQQAILHVNKGHITTIASVFPAAIDINDNYIAEDNVNVSIRLNDTNVLRNINVNRNIKTGIDILAENTFRIKFDDSLNPDIKKIYGSLNSGLAKLCYSTGRKRITYTMIDDLIHISGNMECRKSSSILRIDSNKIIDSHVQIKYLRDQNMFKISVYAPVRLNGRELSVSSGGDVIWYNLANHSQIFINNDVSIDFSIV